MKSIFTPVFMLLKTLRRRLVSTWQRYRRLRKPYQVLIALLVIGGAVWGLTVLRGGAETPATSVGRTVTLASVGKLSNSEGTLNLYGTVRSVTEAKILAQTGGVVRAVHARVGDRVAAGAILAEIENASERAAVLSAEGTYEAALAAQSAVSPVDVQTAALNAYQAAYNTLDTVLKTQVDLFFGGPSVYGPALRISANTNGDDLSRERDIIKDRMIRYQSALEDAAERNPETFLAEAGDMAKYISEFLSLLSDVANRRSSDASDDQLAALAAARTSVNGVVASLATALQTYRSQSVTTTSSTEASVKQALGALRSAQAALERTMLRAPIGGQVNFLPVRVGDYVTSLQHVATVAQNGSLEVVAFVSEDNRNLLAAGSEVQVEGVYRGVITSIAPALDPTTKQIEVRIAVTGANSLVNGQSVTIALPDTASVETPAETGPVLLPLSTVKLRLGDRVIFTVDPESRLVAHPVEVGEVRGDKIEILTPLDLNLKIVSDARGLADGEAVRVAPEESAVSAPEEL